MNNLPSTQAIDAYAKLQQARFDLGKQRFWESRKYQRDYDINAVSPVFYSNMAPPKTNYIRYEPSLYIPKTPYSF